MILLDSCAVLEILWGGEDAARIAGFLDGEQAKGTEIVFPRLALLEASSVLSVRYKEGRISRGSSLEEDLATLASFVVHPTGDDLSIEVIREAALIQFVHAASMVDCYLIADSLRRKAEILSA